ncbi:MAG: hypothetical protein Q8N94_08340 [Methanoregula sp.]|nr:hypothetical protein [Methanoregula sp.]
MLYETKSLLTLVTTWIIEIPVLVALIRFLFKDRDQKISRIIFAGALCTALTLPWLWFVLPPFVDAAYYTLIGKALVVIVEAVILTRVPGLNVK